MPDICGKPIPLLGKEDIECRVQSVTEVKSTKRVGAILLIYKDARVDMRILDDLVGPLNWRCTYEEIIGNLFCNVDIWDETKHEWVRKQDVGTEINNGKEKGHASDAFKRACFKWGIGRELYTAPKGMYVELQEGEYQTGERNGRQTLQCKSSTRFTVSAIQYNERREIIDLTITDKRGNVRYSMRGNRPAQTAPRPVEQPPAQVQGQQMSNAAKGMECPICGGPITQAEADYSRAKYGIPACRKCQKGM